MSGQPKAKPRYNKSTDSWNVFVEVNGKDVPVGTTVGELLDKRLFETTKFNSKQDAIDWISNSPFELKEEK